MKRYRINQQIRTSEVRLISEKGENLGIVNTYEALKMSLEASLDLVEIAPSANPPVCKIIDFKKFLYQERQKEHEAQKKTHKVETKEFRFGPFIGQNDLEKKIERAKEFLAKKDKVKVTVVFRGREKSHPEIGREKVEKFANSLSQIAKVESPIELKGSMMSVLLAPSTTAK